MAKRPALARRIRGKKGTKNRFATSMDPDMTPLINCIFLLLVFFMVATTFVNTKGLSVDLPSGQGEDSSRASKDINIVIDKAGEVQVNGETTSIEELAERIGKIVTTDNIKNVIIEADRAVRHQRVVKVVDIARGQGIEAVAFAKAAEEG
jgi:biopolymer transport protein ExbD|tara:strand:+ start:2156 stop:2605 length:450 start_codon:yes stop_codon:yes gene_type:complete